MDNIGPEKISCLVTDNAANMQKAWKLVSEAQPHIITLGCSAHGLNLLLHDFLTCNSIHGYLSKASEIIKSVKNRGALRNNFHGSTLKSSVSTRWLSWEESIKSLRQNLHALRQLSVHPEAEKELEGRLRASILGDPFWETLGGLLAVISPVSKWIRIVEANTAGVSIIPVAFEELETVFNANSLKMSPLDTADAKKMVSKFQKRKSFILGKTKVANAAHVLDPHFLGRFLDRNEAAEANELVMTFCEDEEQKNLVIKELAAFMTKSDQFSSCFMWKSVAAETDSPSAALEKRESMPPLRWWRAFHAKSPLYPVANRLLSISATSAAVERTFSLQGFLHCKRRNRLNHSTVKRLMNVAMNAKFEAEAAGRLACGFGMASDFSAENDDEDGDEEEEEIEAIENDSDEDD